MRKARVICLSVLVVAAACCLSFSSGLADGPAKDAPAAVTFTKDVAPILFNNCVECHRPNDVAPMSLLTYKDARPWARSIKEAVTTKQMPPWSADPHYGKFTNDRSLSQKDVDTIAAWVDQGAVEGNARDLPAAPAFVDGWVIGKPDAVLSMQETYTVQPNGPDEYIYFTIPTNFKEDRWVQATEIHPGNKRVVHHVIAFVQPPEVIAMMKAAGGGRGREFAGQGPNSIFYQDGKLVRVKADAQVIDDGCANPNGGSALGRRSGEGLGGMALLTGYAPGKDVDIWQPGEAKKIPAGSNIVFQVHYSNFRGSSNKPETDRTTIAFVFAKEPPKKIIGTLGIQNHYFELPPGDPSHQVTGCYTFDKDVTLIDYMPHMHLRGKDMKYDVIYPDGRTETLLWVPRYNFNWQTTYKLKEPVFLPKGTKFIVTAHFDNSEKNKYNPDPTKTVRWGDPTYDEMMIGWMDYEVDKPKDRVVAKVDPKIFDQYVGLYQVTPTFTLTVTREGDRLMGQATGQPVVQLFPESETKYFLKVMDIELIFAKSETGEITGVTLNMNGMQLRAKKVANAATPPAK